MIPVLPLRLDFTLGADARRLPAYLGSLWRSALGATLRQQVCITGAPNCDGCHLVHRCAYGFLFDTPQPAQAGGLAAQYAQLPHPYVISPRAPGGTYRAGDRLSMDLTLIGPGERFLPELLSAVANLRLGPTPLALESVTLLPPVTDIAENTTVAKVLDSRAQAPQAPAAPDTVRIDFQHPLRLRRDNRYLRPAAFDFGTFFTTLMRRISMLHALTDATPLASDPRALAEHARSIECQPHGLRWYDWARKSARQKQRIPMGGITGSLRLSGDLAPLWPWLWVGQWLHVGKGAVMGLGRYRLQPA